MTKQFFYENAVYLDDGIVKIPDGAKEIPEDHWFLQSSSIPEGKKIVTGNDGLPALVDIDPPLMEDIAGSAINTIDNEAGQVRKSLVSPGYAIEDEYWIAADEAKRFLSDTSQPTPSAIKTHAEVYGVSDEEAAKTIIQVRDNWISIMEAVRDVRLKGKKQITDAVESGKNADEITAIADNVKKQLQAIREQALAVAEVG